MNRMKKNGVLPIILFICAVLFLASILFPIPYYIESPGSAEGLSQLVTVDGKKDDEEGSFMLTTVGVRQATGMSALLSFLFPYQELVSKEDLMGDSKGEEYDQMQTYYMESSQNTAIQVAMNLAGKEYKMLYKGIYVMSISDQSSFVNQLEIGDTIYAIDGHTFESADAFMEYIKSQTVDKEITINYERDKEKKEVTGKLIEIEGDDGEKRAGIGISLTDHTEIETSIPVKIDAENIGGPSAGLMFTLETYSMLSGKDLRKGHQIAGTGTISEDGEVGRIGGIDKKVVAADKAGAEIFFAPDDSISKEIKKKYPDLKTNYQEAQATAEKIKTDMKIVPVKNVTDALDYLEKLN